MQHIVELLEHLSQFACRGRAVSQPLAVWEAESLPMCCGRALGSPNNPSSWIHWHYICPTEDLVLNHPGAFWCWIKALTSLKLTSSQSPPPLLCWSLPFQGRAFLTGQVRFRKTLTLPFLKLALELTWQVLTVLFHSLLCLKSIPPTYITMSMNE